MSSTWESHTTYQPEPNKGSKTQMYPCDRGIPENVDSRGWHHFEASPSGIAVCKYCGERAKRQ